MGQARWRSSWCAEGASGIGSQCSLPPTGWLSNSLPLPPTPRRVPAGSSHAGRSVTPDAGTTHEPQPDSAARTLRAGHLVIRTQPPQQRRCHPDTDQDASDRLVRAPSSSRARRAPPEVSIVAGSVHPRSFWWMGERVGLYRALAESGASISSELAARTGTTERYVRELLEHHAASASLGASSVRPFRRGSAR